jgi:hypothetical protein
MRCLLLLMALLVAGPGVAPAVEGASSLVSEGTSLALPGVAAANAGGRALCSRVLERHPGKRAANGERLGGAQLAAAAAGERQWRRAGHLLGSRSDAHRERHDNRHCAAHGVLVGIRGHDLRREPVLAI